MNKAFVASVMLGGCTTFAFAQDALPASSAGATTVNAAASVQATCADCRAGSLHYVGEQPGGHDIAVFAGEPSAQAGRQGDWTAAAAPRHTYGRLGGFGPGDGPGRFTLGRQYNLEYLTQADVGDPLHTGTAGQASNLVNPTGTRVNSDVRYYSSRMNGVSTDASWTVDTLGGSSMANRAWGMTVGYDLGPISLRAAHQNRHVAQVQLYNLAGNNMDAKNSIVAANLRMRWGTAYAAYAANRGWGSSPLYNPDNPYSAGVASTSSTDSRDMLMGVAVPMTRSTTFLASFIHKNDRDLANRDARQFAIGASYVLSRKTDFYAAFSHTVNTNGAGILVGDGIRPNGSSAINVGMRHAF
ncbi:porin [uncultured Massilia sp.]|uniref:porin n=1 Tax=uncultured Massilia sp. TaxID=169973 RepID=UPI0025F251DC|nr:porin [uncultured Massilia sp.]